MKLILKSFVHSIYVRALCSKWSTELGKYQIYWIPNLTEYEN